MSKTAYAGKESRYIGLILAAGFSSRMGSFKPLLQIGDMTAVERIAAALKMAGIQNIIGVTGFQRERLTDLFALAGIREVYNPNFAQGMFTSVKAGIREALSAEWPAEIEGQSADAERQPDVGKSIEGFFLMPVDCPLVPGEIIRQMIKVHGETPQAFVVPCYRGKKGHPLLIPAGYADEILAFEGDGGMKGITSRHEDRMVRLETGTEAVVLDMDTQEGYQEVLAFYETMKGTSLINGKESELYKAEINLEDKLYGKRLFLIRHGQIRQHKEKIFLGQTDVPLSDTGQTQAAAVAEELLRYGVKANRIYTSDLSRAAETAEIISNRLEERQTKEAQQSAPYKVAVIRDSGLREIALGEWDGRYVSEIKALYPDEYRQRGEDLLAYKYGNSSENYYDLQYRVIKCIHSIFNQENESEDAGEDIIIVSHAGVINVILSNLYHIDLAEQIKAPVPNGGLAIYDSAMEEK